jgi:hypothetical protein
MGKPKSKKRIAFLNIDKTYSIYHSISVAIELAESFGHEVHVLCTRQNLDLIKTFLKKFNCSTIQVKVLRPYWYFTLPHYLEIKLQLRKVLFMKYKKLLSGFDGFVSTLYDDADLKKSFPGKKFVYTTHGAGSNPYAFDNRIKNFDLFFIAGKKDWEQRKLLRQLTDSNHVITGYVKYDLLKKDPVKEYFKNGKPTVLYNPHWVPGQSSFFKFGLQILDFFAVTEQYNLIFAPHSLLFVRNKRFWLKMLQYKKYSNILIDTGSETGNDMSYTKTADLYLGDSSSQALEFLLIKERPCLFLDAYELQQTGEDQFIAWTLGDVISDLDHIGISLDKAFEEHEHKYLRLQKELMNEMFEKTSSAPSYLAAEAVSNLFE